MRFKLWIVVLLVCPTLTSSGNRTCLIKSDAELTKQDFFQTGIESSWLAIGVVNGILAIPIAGINWLIVWTILSHTRLSASSYNILLSALAFTDLVSGGFIQPLFAWYQVCLPFNCIFPCQFTVISLSSLCITGVTLTTLAIASIERYLAVEFPVFHRAKITRRVVTTATIIGWLVVTPTMIASRVLITTTDAVRKLPVSLVISVNVLVILYCNVKVNITAYRKKRRIAAQQNTEQTADEKGEIQRKLEDYRKAVSMGLIVLGSIACYIPVIALTLIDVSGVLDHSEYLKLLLQPISVTFIFLQSLANPIIVSLRIQCIRNSLEKKLKFN